MTRTFNTLAIAAVALSLAVPLAYVQSTQTTPRIAYINSTKIMEQTPGRAELEALLKKEVAPYDAKIAILSDSNVAITTKYETERPNLTPDARASREKEILAKRAAWQDKADSINLKKTERVRELQAPMLEALTKILDAIRQEEGFWMIIDVVNEGGLIVSIDRNMEITDRVLARFKVAAAALPKPGSPAASTPANPAAGAGAKIPPPPGVKIPPPSLER